MRASRIVARDSQMAYMHMFRIPFGRIGSCVRRLECCILELDVLLIRGNPPSSFYFIMLVFSAGHGSVLMSDGREPRNKRL